MVSLLLAGLIFSHRFLKESSTKSVREVPLNKARPLFLSVWGLHHHCHDDSCQSQSSGEGCHTKELWSHICWMLRRKNRLKHVFLKLGVLCNWLKLVSVLWSKAGSDDTRLHWSHNLPLFSVHHYSFDHFLKCLGWQLWVSLILCLCASLACDIQLVYFKTLSRSFAVLVARQWGSDEEIKFSQWDPAVKSVARWNWKLC